MTSDRPYRKGLGYERAREEIVRFSGIQFDPDVVEAFLHIRQSDWAEIAHRAAIDPAVQRPVDVVRGGPTRTAGRQRESIRNAPAA